MNASRRSSPVLAIVFVAVLCPTAIFPQVEQSRPQLTVPCEVEQIMKGLPDNGQSAVDPGVAPGAPGSSANIFPRLDALNLVIATDPAYTIRGDADGNGVIDTADREYLVRYLFEESVARPRFIRGNANHNCLIDSGDIFYLTNYLFSGGPAPAL